VRLHSQSGLQRNQSDTGTQNMPVVPVEKLEPGMVLAKPLIRGTMVILGEGTVLTGGWISRIADMGVERVFIDGPSVQAVSREEALARLNLRFRNVDDRPHMKQIKEIARAHIEGLYD
jgi:hypothetical protein